jgi:rod shape-determining protein MreB and related proteins
LRDEFPAFGRFASLDGYVDLRGTSRIHRGGYDLDEAIVKLLQDTQRLLVGQEQAEMVKLEIGAAVHESGGPTVADVAGRDLTTGLLRRTTIDADSVCAALQRPLAQIIEGVELVLERTPPELSSDIASRGLMLVGGGACCVASTNSYGREPVSSSAPQTTR